MEATILTLSFLATAAAAISAYYASKSASIAKTTLEYYQKPTIIVGHQNGVYLVIRNVGPGVAKSITCIGDANINIVGGKNPIALLIPFQGPSGSKDNYGAEYLMGLRSFGLLNNASEEKITVNYESLLGQKFTSKFLITKQEIHEYKIEPIEFG